MASPCFPWQQPAMGIATHKRHMHEFYVEQGVWVQSSQGPIAQHGGSICRTRASLLPRLRRAPDLASKVGVTLVSTHVPGWLRSLTMRLRLKLLLLPALVIIEHADRTQTNGGIAPRAG